MSFQREQELLKVTAEVSQSARRPSNTVAVEEEPHKWMNVWPLSVSRWSILTLLLTTLNPAELWECLHFRPQPVSWIKTGSGGKIMQKTGGSLCNSDWGGTQRHGCGVRSYRRGGGRGVWVGSRAAWLLLLCESQCFSLRTEFTILSHNSYLIKKKYLMSS